ncbi:hypothetical protein Dimus_011109, partial [Dionaea muscipula]
RQKWERLFKRRELMHIDVVKEFYASLTLIHYKKKEVARARVRGVDIEFDNMRLDSILGVTENNGICEYIKDVWEESKYTKPLEIIRKFANDNMIMEARRVRSVEIKPFQRFVHFLVMKNVVPRFGKRDTTSYMDLIYIDHLISRRLVNLPRVMMKHMSYVISMKDHELPYGDWLTMVFEAFDRVNGVWWLGSSEHRRRDDEEVAPAENEEVNEEEAEAQPDFDWEVVVDEATLQGEYESDDQFYDAQVEVEEPVAEAPAVPVFSASPRDSTNLRKEPATAGVDPSIPTGSIPEPVMLNLQAELEQ